MWRRHSLFPMLLLAPALTWFGPASARATSIVPADVPELVSEAQVIVHGRIVGVRAEWVEGRRDIETFVTLEAAGYLKGDFGRRVVFRVPGGELGLYRSIVVGAPVFVQGDEVVLFLGARGPSVPHVLGLSQGVFRVSRARDGSRALVVLPVPLSGRDRHPPMALDRFQELVRDLAARGIPR